MTTNDAKARHDFQKNEVLATQSIRNIISEQEGGSI